MTGIIDHQIVSLLQDLLISIEGVEDLCPGRVEQDLCAETIFLAQQFADDFRILYRPQQITEMSVIVVADQKCAAVRGDPTRRRASPSARC
jgi:hypothetical protein